MAWRSDIVVTGALETQEALISFGIDKVPLAMRRAIGKGAVILREAIRAEAASSFEGQNRKHPNQLYNSIRVSSQSQAGRLLTVKVGPQKKGSGYRGLVIWGHDITRQKMWSYDRTLHTSVRSSSVPILGRTRPNDFVKRGEDVSADAAQEAIAAAFAVAVATAGKP